MKEMAIQVDGLLSVMSARGVEKQTAYRPILRSAQFGDPILSVLKLLEMVSGA